MFLKNKKLVATVRILLGLFITFSGVSGLIALANGFEGIPTDMLWFTEVLTTTGIMQLVKVSEIIAGLMLIINFRTAFALIILSPIILGATVVNIMVAPAYILTPVIIGALMAYLGWIHFDKYRPLFQK